MIDQYSAKSVDFALYYIIEPALKSFRLQTLNREQTSTKGR